MIRTIGKGLAALSLGMGLVLLGGCGGGGAASSGTTAPQPPSSTNRSPSITAFSVSPTSLTYVGGTVTYSVTATDPDGDALTVTIIVTEPNGDIKTLSPQSGVGGTFTVQYNSPGNISSNGQIVRYTAVARVSDGVNAPVTSTGVPYTVTPPPAGPPSVPPPVRP